MRERERCAYMWLTLPSPVHRQPRPMGQLGQTLPRQQTLPKRPRFRTQFRQLVRPKRPRPTRSTPLSRKKLHPGQPPPPPPPTTPGTIPLHRRSRPPNYRPHPHPQRTPQHPPRRPRHHRLSPLQSLVHTRSPTRHLAETPIRNLHHFISSSPNIIIIITTYIRPTKINEISSRLLK